MTISKSLAIALPSVQFTLFVLTLSTGNKPASGGNPFFCLALPWSLPLVARDDTAIVAAVGILATAWWYFIGKIGFLASEGRMSRSGATLGAALIFFMCFVEAALMTSEFKIISAEADYGAIDRVIYALAAMLLVGGAISASCAAIAVLRRTS